MGAKEMSDSLQKFKLAENILVLRDALEECDTVKGKLMLAELITKSAIELAEFSYTELELVYERKLND